MNAMWRPLGENAGLSLLPMPSVTLRRLAGREAVNLDVEAGAGARGVGNLVERLRATRSDDRAQISLVSFCWPVPSAFMM